MTVVNQTVRVRRRVNVQFKGLLRLPAKGRIERGMNMKCDACGEQIEDDTFIGAFPLSGTRNMLLHEKCVAPEDRHMLPTAKKPEAPHDR